MLGRLLSLGYTRGKRERTPESQRGPNPSASLGTCGVPLFRSQCGKRLGARQVQLRFTQRPKQVGITRRVSIHSLRHSW